MGSRAEVQSDSRIQTSQSEMHEPNGGAPCRSNFGSLCEGQVSYTKSFKQSSLLQ